MRITNARRLNTAFQIALDLFATLHKEGDRFYVYKNHYYMRVDSSDGWLIDLSNHRQVIEDLEYDGRIRRPWTRYKAVIPEKLLQLAKPVAQQVDTSGVRWDEVGEPHMEERYRLEKYVNMCDLHNRNKTKGNQR
jgi:hypothetical protein